MYWILVSISKVRIFILFVFEELYKQCPRNKNVILFWRKLAKNRETLISNQFKKIVLSRKKSLFQLAFLWANGMTSYRKGLKGRTEIMGPTQVEFRCGPQGGLAPLFDASLALWILPSIYGSFLQNRDLSQNH